MVVYRSYVDLMDRICGRRKAGWWQVCDMDDGVLVRLKDIELDVVVYEVPTSGGMMAVLPSGTLGMCLESVIGGTVLNQGFGDVVVYHRIIFSGYDSLVGWVWSDCVEEV